LIYSGVLFVAASGAADFQGLLLRGQQRVAAASQRYGAADCRGGVVAPAACGWRVLRCGQHAHFSGRFGVKKMPYEFPVIFINRCKNRMLN
jgi:hypothetical protein